MNAISRILALAGLVACSSTPPTPAKLAAYSKNLPQVVAQCDAETVPELRILCDQEVAVRYAANGDTAQASERCEANADPVWAAECHFLVAETLAGVGLLEGALSECVLASTFVVSCVEHVAMLQEVPHSPSVTTDEIRSYTDQADETIQRRLSALPEHLRTPLRDWIRFGRVQAWVVGNGPFPAGFGEGTSDLAVLERTVRGIEAARGMQAGAPYSTVRTAYQGDVTWPATEAGSPTKTSSK